MSNQTWFSFGKGGLKQDVFCFKTSAALELFHFVFSGPCWSDPREQTHRQERQNGQDGQDSGQDSGQDWKPFGLTAVRGGRDRLTAWETRPQQCYRAVDFFIKDCTVYKSQSFIKTWLLKLSVAFFLFKLFNTMKCKICFCSIAQHFCLKMNKQVDLLIYMQNSCKINDIPAISLLRGLVTRGQHFTVIIVSLKANDLLLGTWHAWATSCSRGWNVTKVIATWYWYMASENVVWILLTYVKRSEEVNRLVENPIKRPHSKIHAPNPFNVTSNHTK